MNLNRRSLLRNTAAFAALATPMALAPARFAHAATYSGIVQTSGNAQIDRILGLALSRLAATFQVSPGFAFYDDSDGENAVALADVTKVGNGPGTVLFGLRLFRRLMNQYKDNGVTVISVCAHEFGHIHQKQRVYQHILSQMDTTARPVELHADYLAGFFLGVRKTQYPDLDLHSVGQAMYDAGEHSTDRSHHGTPEERYGAIKAGFDFGRSGDRTINDAARSGIDYLRRTLG